MTILAIDDDITQLERLRLLFARMDYPPVRFVQAEDVAGGLAIILNNLIDLVLTDLRLPDGSGIDILKRTKSLNPMIPVVVMTAYSDAREAVTILKSGADDYLVKPTDEEELKKLVLRVYEKNVLIHESFLPPSNGASASPAAAGIIYCSDAIARVMRTAARCAASDATVLISGESGTGKELVANFIHERGDRADKPFIAVNISALPEALAESELFGHKKGSFTSADTDRVGRFEDANGGTLFIDEIGDVSPLLQVKLLRAIQFGIIERVGENVPRQLDVRIIAATNHDLAELVSQGKFRRDLFYRINVINLFIPPLRERKEDIPLLIDHFISHFNQRNGRSVQGLSREALDILIRHSFPGNVRELENIIERAVVLSSGDLILARDLPPLENVGYESFGSSDGGQVVSKDYSNTMLLFEHRLVAQALRENDGNKSAAARQLGISERHLRSRLERLAAGGFPIA